MSTEDPPPDDIPPRRRGPSLQVRVGIGLVALALLAAAGLAIDNARQYARLLRADPDQVPEKSLAAFASAQGERLFAQDCAGCHGAAMQGDRARGAPDLTDDDWLYGTGRIPEIERIIRYGIRSGTPRAWNLSEMPGFGKPRPSRTYKADPLTPGQIRDVVQYLRLIEDRPADAAAAARGVTVYSTTGACFDCHSEDGRGDPAIGAPNLVDGVWLYGDGSDRSIFKSIAGGHRGICPAWVDRLKPGEIRALAVHIHIASHKPPGSRQAAAARPRQERPS